MNQRPSEPCYKDNDEGFPQPLEHRLLPALDGYRKLRKNHRIRNHRNFGYSTPKTLFLGVLILATASLVSAPAVLYQDYASEENDSNLYSTVGARIRGIVNILVAHPTVCFGASLRIAIAIALELVLDGFLKTVVTPAIAGTGIGILVTPLTFFIGQALQPIIHSVSFLFFDDRFLDVVLEATGTKSRLVKSLRLKEWHRLSLVEGMVTRHCLKAMTAWCVGLAGLATLIPVVGPILTAVLSGWIVAWDYVYVPLSGIGYVGVVNQFWAVWRDFGKYQWFGVFAVLLEEIPLAGPALHVYNVYSAAFLLEDVYGTGSTILLNATMAAATGGHKEL